MESISKEGIELIKRTMMGCALIWISVLSFNLIQSQSKSNDQLLSNLTSQSGVDLLPIESPAKRKQPDESFKLNQLPIKWESYADLEALQKAKKMEVYAPGDLPKGFILQKTEVWREIVKATYRKENQSIVFIQKPAQEANHAQEKWTQTEQETIVTWSTTKHDFEIRGAHVSEADIQQFQQSIRPLVDDVTLPFEVIECSGWLSDSIAPRARTFSIFTPAEFIEYVERQDINLKKKWSSNENTIVLGLFAGQKGNSGYSIQTRKVVLQNSQLNVWFQELEPAPDQYYLAVITYPFEFIKIQLPADQKVDTVQFITEKGQAIAHEFIHHSGASTNLQVPFSEK